MEARPLLQAAVLMDPGRDNVAIATEDIPEGTVLSHGNDTLSISSEIRAGHRFALRDIPEGEYLMQFGHPFGRSKGIGKGQAVTTNNVLDELPPSGAEHYTEPPVTEPDPKYSGLRFMGYKRPGGKAGTRNYFLVVPTSMCSSQTALDVAQAIDTRDVLSAYPNLDGVVAIPNTEGCGCDSGLQIDRFLTVLKGYITHPNVGGCLIMDLGCEQTNYDRVFEYLGDGQRDFEKPIEWVTIQKSGGTRAATEEGIRRVMSRLTEATGQEREPIEIGHIVAGLECGASDSFSGITANPVIGRAVDKLVLGGGSAILTEIPEMLGTYGMLLNRFRSFELAGRYQGLIEWYEGLAGRLGLSLSANLVPKNIEGGLINNYIKSLGAVMKGGTTPIEDVIEYSEPVKAKGLSIMQGPGGDPESVTGLVGAGANVVLFSTGHGTITGNAICPVIKVVSNDRGFNALPEDMDFNAGRVISERMDIDALGEELLGLVVDVASGRRTWSEKWRQRQFQVWTAGKLPL